MPASDEVTQILTEKGYTKDDILAIYNKHCPTWKKILLVFSSDEVHSQIQSTHDLTSLLQLLIIYRNENSQSPISKTLQDIWGIIFRGKFLEKTLIRTDTLQELVWQDTIPVQPLLEVTSDHQVLVLSDAVFRNSAILDQVAFDKDLIMATQAAAAAKVLCNPGFQELVRKNRVTLSLKLIRAIQTDAAADILCNQGFQELVLNTGLLLTLELIEAIQTDATAKVLCNPGFQELVRKNRVIFNFTPELVIAIQTDAAAKVLCNPGFQKLVLNMGLLLTLELITAIQTDATAKVLCNPGFQELVRKNRVMFNFTPKLIIAIQTDAAAKVLCNPGFQKLVLNMGLLLTLELITAIQTDATAKVLCNPEFLACLRRNNEALTLQIIARINGDALSPEDSIRLIETPNVLEKRHLGIKAAQRSGSPIHHHSIEPQKSKQAYKQDHEIPGGSMLRL